MVGVRGLREFMSQSASRCLLCLARGWVIIHTNGCPDKTELGRNKSSKLRQPCSSVFAKPLLAAATYSHPTEEERGGKGGGKDQMCVTTKVSFIVVCSGGSLELHLFSFCRLQSICCISLCLFRNNFHLLPSLFCLRVLFSLSSTQCLFLQSFSSLHQPSFITHFLLLPCLSAVPRLSEYLLQS